MVVPWLRVSINKSISKWRRLIQTKQWLFSKRCTRASSSLICLDNSFSFSLGLSSLIFFSKLFVLELDLSKLFHVFFEVWTSLQSDEQLSLLAAVTSRSLDGDGSCSDLLEGGVLVSKIIKWTCQKRFEKIYLRQFIISLFR